MRLAVDGDATELDNFFYKHITTLFLMKKILLLLFVACMVACGHKAEPTVTLESEADIAGKRVGYTSGTIYELMFSPRTDIDKFSFNMQSDAIEALVKGQVDVVLDDDCNIPKDEQRRLGVRLVLHGEKSFECAFAMHKDSKALCEGLSLFIDSLRSTGELQSIYNRWFESDVPGEVRMPDFGPKPQGEPLRAAMGTTMPPVSFPVGSEGCGFEPEILTRYAYSVGRPIEIQFLPTGSAIAALQSKKVDFLGGAIFITEERQKTMLFSASHFSAHPGYFVKDASMQANVSFGDRMKNAVKNNLVVEDRWRYITDGLWETVKISIFAILLGTVFGCGICWMRMSRRKWLSVTAKVYIDLMRGIPMLVLLMIMFYVVLAKVGVGATTVAVVAFALNFAAYVSEMFRTAIGAVSKGQTEAGLALGFTRWQTFIHIVAPQALRNVMPVYKGEAISLVKNTSIVGYIAIQDLTRASDMIRTRTFNAFFPLLLVTIIYFIIAWVLGKLLDLAIKK